MVRAIIIAGFLLSLTTTGSTLADKTTPAQSILQRHVTATQAVTDFRSVGETRLWTFFARQQRLPFGQFVSVLKEQTQIDGRDVVVLSQKLDIDYTKIGTDRKVTQSGETRLTREGNYLGTNFTIGAGDSAQKLELNCDAGHVKGFYTRGGAEVPVDVPLDNDLPAWDPNFFDGLEIFLARQILDVGDSVSGEVYSPQSMLTSSVRGYVTAFMRREIYQGRFDSVYVIDIAEPQVYQAFFTPDKRLVRLDLADKNIRIYQDLVRKGAQDPAKKALASRVSPLSPRIILFHLPHYIAYIVIAAGAVLFLSRRGFKWLDSYLLLAGGAICVVVIVFTQMPLQKWLVTTFLAPHAAEGGAIYAWALLPPLVAGILQELFKWVALTGLLGWRRIKEYRYVTLGAFLGAGFGIFESGYILGTSVPTLLGWQLLERALVIVFHVAGGSLLGHAIARGRAALTVALPVLVVVNSVIRYLPVFVQQGDIDLGMMHFILAFLSLGFLAATLIVLRRTPARVQDSAEETQSGL